MSWSSVCGMIMTCLELVHVLHRPSDKQLHCVCVCVCVCVSEDDTDLLIQHSCDSKVSQLHFHPSAGEEDILHQRDGNTD